MKYPGLPSYSDDPGKIYTLDMLDPSLTPVPLHIEGDFDQKSFNPHGISAFTDENGMTVFVQSRWKHMVYVAFCKGIVLTFQGKDLYFND